MHTESDDLRAALIDSVFPLGQPPLLSALLPPRWDPARFGAGPIYTSTGHHRFYVASDGRDPRWDARVCAAAPEARALLADAPPGVRRMVDTDGKRIDVYLDDLHLHGPAGVMCETVTHPGGGRSTLRFVDTLPAQYTHLSALVGVGRLLLRSGDRESLLWITEAKYTGNIAMVDDLAEQLLGLPAAYAALRGIAPGCYIDGVEVHPSGAVDLTPGFR